MHLKKVDGYTIIKMKFYVKLRNEVRHLGKNITIMVKLLKISLNCGIFFLLYPQTLKSSIITLRNLKFVSKSP